MSIGEIDTNKLPDAKAKVLDFGLATAFIQQTETSGWQRYSQGEQYLVSFNL